MAVLTLGDPVQTGVGPIRADGQQPPLLEDVSVESLAGADGGELAGETDAQVGFFQYVEEVDHPPPPGHLGFEPAQVAGLGDPVAARLGAAGTQREGGVGCQGQLSILVWLLLCGWSLESCELFACLKGIDTHRNVRVGLGGGSAALR